MHKHRFDEIPRVRAVILFGCGRRIGLAFGMGVWMLASAPVAADDAPGAPQQVESSTAGSETPTPLSHTGATQTAAAHAVADLVAQRELEERYGIRITQIAVTAAGGLVDFRFKVLDPAKAKPVLGDPLQMPTLIAADSGKALVTTHNMMHNVRLKKDAVSFALYPNARGAVHTGTPVSVAFNGVRVEPQPAQ